jgi:hypothetical protein
LRPPVNVLRLSLHPAGLAPQIINLAEWREHVLSRLEAQLRVSGDRVLAALLEELSALPAPEPAPRTESPLAGIAVPLSWARIERGGR